jgi:hypothetical protein
MEFELRKSFLPGRQGATRILSYVNKAHMGIYKDAINNYLEGVTPTPDINYNAHFGTIKYGFGWNNWQELTEHLRIYSRFGWNEGAHESFCYTADDESFSFGGDYYLSRWHQPNDKIGVAFVSNAIKKYHQIYLADGGLGFLLGEGRLNYGREDMLELLRYLRILGGLAIVHYLFVALRAIGIDREFVDFLEFADHLAIGIVFVAFLFSQIRRALVGLYPS